jgi:uncharacterized protein (TIGR02118 family)
MAAILVMFKTPKDVAAFDKRYFEAHVPLAKKIPGLIKYEVSQGPVTTPNGASDIHLVAILHFNDLTAIQSALASPEGQAALADRLSFAPEGSVEILRFDSREL